MITPIHDVLLTLEEKQEVLERIEYLKEVMGYLLYEEKFFLGMPRELETRLRRQYPRIPTFWINVNCFSIVGVGVPQEVSKGNGSSHQ